MDKSEFKKIVEEQLEKSRVLRSRWAWSPWRIMPSLAAAYCVTGLYYWTIETPDAWLRAFGPVFTVGTFLVTRPLVQRWWFKREREKIMDDDME